MHRCLGCEAIIKSGHIYCSNKCQADLQYRAYINRWKQGLEHGRRGIQAKNLSGHVKRYLKEKLGEACSECGWNKQNPVTLSVPLEIDHVDGNSENNTEINLRLLCPNCHALTPSFRNLNKGRGRAWRRQKYLKVD